jgi:uncharacterized membrane protein YhaH (DUF805 family)
MDWYLKVLKQYADFKGRAQRKEYWMFFLFNILAAFVLGFVSGFLGAILHVGAGFSSAINLLYVLGTLIPSIAVGIRRMHDLGRSGWWIICPIVNIVFLFIDSQPGSNEYGPNPKEAISA